MKKSNKRISGFTLIELIIVMAIFSILLVGAISLIGPVQRIFKTTSNSEKIGAHINTAQQYVEDSLKFAEYLWIYTDLDSANVEREVENYYEEFYKDVVRYDGKDAEFIEGTIRVMCLENDNGGQITMAEYRFEDNSMNASGVTPQPQLPQSFFSRPSTVTENFFRYSLGVDELVKANDATTGERVESLSNDKNNVKLDVSKLNLNLSVLAAQEDVGDVAGTDYTYSTFAADTCYLSVASIPLMNINYNSTLTRMKLQPTITLADLKNAGPNNWVSEGLTQVVSRSSTALNSFRQLEDAFDPADQVVATTKTDFQDLHKNIYFIYSYVDEITA